MSVYLVKCVKYNSFGVAKFCTMHLLNPLIGKSKKAFLPIRKSSMEHFTHEKLFLSVYSYLLGAERSFHNLIYGVQEATPQQ